MSNNDDDAQSGEADSEASDIAPSLSRRKLLSATSVVGGVGLVAGAGTRMLFSDRETFANNGLRAGELELGITWTEYYNDEQVSTMPADGSGTYVDSHEAAIDLTEVEPDDRGTLIACVKLHDAGRGNVWLRVAPVVFAENGITDIEEEAGDDTKDEGELQEYLDVALWRDENRENGNQVEGDGVFVESSFQSMTDTLQDGTLLAENANEVCVGFRWRLPDEVDPVVVSDSVTFTFEFAATQKRNPDNPWK